MRREFSRLPERLRRGRAKTPQMRSVHLLARRDDGEVTAACVRHLRTPPSQSSRAADLTVVRDIARVTCPLCRAAEVA